MCIGEQPRDSQREFSSWILSLLYIFFKFFYLVLKKDKLHDWKGIPLKQINVQELNIFLITVQLKK